MHNDNDDDLAPAAYDDDELRLLALLPREAAVAPDEFERLRRRLSQDGFFRPPMQRWRVPALAAAALLLLATGFAAGRFLARRDSLEDLLARRNLSAGDRILLLQRAGSAYVRAAQSYADATATIDSSAVEVASKVLVGAAHAVARSSLDAGLAARLTDAVQPPVVPRAAAPRKPITWF